MRHWRGLMGITAIAAGAAMVPGTGCVFGVDFNDCAVFPGAACDGSGGVGSGGGGEPPGPCEGDPREDASAVSETCGVFARAGAKGTGEGEGTRERPYGSLQEAIEKAGAEGKRVYACAEAGEAFEESVRIEAGIEVIGGFACAGWTLEEGSKSGIEGPADTVALTIGEGADGARVEGFAIRAADATQPGGSSIGVAVADVEAELVAVEVTAGTGMEGARGTTPSEAPMAGAAAPAEVSAACAAEETVLGGAGAVTSCEDGETAGGLGGTGGLVGMNEGNGQAGADGEPVPEENPTGRGLGGIGETADLECEQGANGKSGAAGVPGTGGTGATLELGGIAGGDGGRGTTGTRGQGGGGGGGAKAGLFCLDAAMVPIEGAGASGGGGGAGGCGGKGGGGGQAGGSSIGIVSLGNRLTLTGVTIAVGQGGKGGDGAAGQSGAAGGNGAAGGLASGTAPSKSGCDGGKGGAGGPGGAGGGGRGGYAVGIAYAVAPSEAPVVQYTAGTAGLGGAAGPGGAPESAGASGNEGSCWDFAAQAPCGGMK
ncbi:hypothetical protein WMF31_16410 [Sorangium sp. So ce1036]|uniref:hypothetical protein n=1 Tax=Sorangium sp. So ce1036 TaxID=3133328 RepID=UPI003F11779A